MAREDEETARPRIRERLFSGADLRAIADSAGADPFDTPAKAYELTRFARGRKGIGLREPGMARLNRAMTESRLLAISEFRRPISDFRLPLVSFPVRD